MGLTITGYVLEPPRVGASNSPFTLTPNNLISDQVAFDTAYPADESAPRTEYLVQVLQEQYSGPTGPGGKYTLTDALFGWTKNEGAVQQGLQVPFQRFDYSGEDQRFKMLQGAPRETPGVLQADANTNRLTVVAPVITDLVAFPVRIALGSTGSGTTIAVTVVADDSSFGSPSVGTVEISQETGNLNWNPTDVTSYEGQPVYYQRQSFYLPSETTGSVGTIGSGDEILLNPIPTTGQIPALSFGSRAYLTVIERANDASLSANPALGTVEWSLETGLIKINATDAVTYAGQSLVYDGVLCGTFQVPATDVGTVGNPITLGLIPDSESDAFFRISGVRQFPTTSYVEALSFPGKAGVVQIETGTGDVQFSATEQLTYSGQTVQLVIPDVEIERGVTLRLFRTPVDKGATDSTIKDVTATYTSEAATIADPIVAQPLVFLPALPLDDQPLEVRVQSGSGSQLLARLDGVGPVSGLGYLIDFENRQLLYGERKLAEVIEASSSDYGALQLPHFPVYSSGLVVQQESSPGSGTWVGLTEGEDYDIDLASGVLTFSTTSGQILVESSGADISAPMQLNDTSVDFVAAGVVSGDFLVVTSGANEGVYVIDVVATASLTIEETFPLSPTSPIQYEVRRSYEVLADRYWREVPKVDPNTAVSRVYGVTTTPLTLGVDYEIQPGTGFIEFAERMLADEEVILNYATLGEDGNKVPVSGERGVFLVSKELVQPHTTPTSTLGFNPEGKEVASVPAPRVWRGGRPQSSDQVLVDVVNSTITFLDDSVATDALPSGSIVGPDENVYVDYYIYGALGGEKSLTVVNPPVAISQVSIEDGETFFVLDGDRTSDFPASHLLRVDGQEVYLMGSPIFDGTQTTVNLDQSLSQAFKSDFSNPLLEVSSGPILRVPVGTTPAYFEAEANSYDPAPRGSKKIRIEGDVARQYTGGTVLLFSDGSAQDYVFSEGALYDSDSDRTEVTLGGGIQAEYKAPVTLSRSVRPVLATPSAQAQTSRAPTLTQTSTVFRRILGEAGTILTSGVDYTLDASGTVTLANPLQINEEVGIFYTGYELVPGGTRHRVSWSYVIVPSVENGMLNQVLTMDYATYIPDTFFCRVETMTNFRGELAQQFSDEAKANSPSQGPTLENSGGQLLYEKGNASLYFDENHLANEDLVARPTLCFYNDAINYLEDYLEEVGGLTVGDKDGRFLFDGLLDNPVRANFSEVTNQIDDVVTIFGSVTAKAYQASAVSRFFPTSRRSVGEVEATPAKTGDVVFNARYKPLTSLSSVVTRPAYALVTAYAVAGTTTLIVDGAEGFTGFTRPSFEAGMVIEILDVDGSVLDATGLTVLSTTPTTIGLSGGVTADIPVGATVRRSDDDTTYRIVYPSGTYVYPIVNDGLIAYIDASAFLPNPPFTSIPVPQVGEAWDVDLNTFHNDTEPYRFPALDGLASDDDGDIQTTPLLSPKASSELALDPSTLSATGAGLTSREASHLNATLASVTLPTTLVGSLDGPGTTLSLDSGTFSVTPRAGDLVRVTSGTNASTTWVRVTGGTAASATLEAFFTTDSGFDFIITNSPSVASGTGATVSVTGTTFVDTAADFTSDGVVPGHTVVVETGSNALERRNVVSVDSGTQLTLSSAFTNDTTTFTYRVDNHLNTFGGTPGSSLEQWVQALTDVELVYDGEIAALESYINTVGTDVVASTTGQTLGAQLTDVGADFSDVSTLDYVFVRSGTNAGIYQIADVTSTTQLSIDVSFPLNQSGLSYRILRTTGASFDGLSAVQAALINSDSAALDRDTAESAYVVGTVYQDAGAFAHGLTAAFISSRIIQVTDRATIAGSDVINVSAVMSSIDRLYDTRFAWIDGRINLERGILAKKERAVENREKALAQIVKDLTKLLTA